MKKFTIIIFLFFIISLLKAQNEKQYNVGCIAFYNIENLFDTLPGDNDKEFTPEGPKNWNTKKYYEKLGNIAFVINQLGSDVTGSAPAVVGLSEIENISVLEDLVKTDPIAQYDYQIVHFDGPDHRGVDCALLYRSEFFKVKHTSMYKVVMNDMPDFTTRDQLVVTGDYDEEEITFIVLHWPSRSGGEKASRPKRVAAADLTRHIVDSILNVSNQAKIVIMGDLNDDPVDQSVKKHLKTAGDKNKAKAPLLYNPMEELFKKGVGSLAYDDKWNLFDQIIISPAFLEKDRASYRFYQVHVFNKSFLLQKEGRYKGYPLRTYVGNTYMGGYSDHFPVYIFIIKEL
ncbi:MAG: endonuclease/exonuclease/phosphatase family protein [Bacteroidales bacterium]|jgi:exonuclease III|nr:endonuclease/exonuclease/phosphatase family protein [Bacteroidales bacterium]